MLKALDRRQAVATIGAALLLPAARTARAAEHEEEGVEALEDLMREHGVLRRALLVYAEAATRVIFPAWKAAISKAQYEELSEEFEELEHRMFGKDGFDDAVERITKIEQAFGLADLSELTAAPPPKPA